MAAGVGGHRHRLRPGYCVLSGGAAGDDVDEDLHQLARVAQHEGLTTGVGGTNTFQPDRPITRAEAITLLHRAVTN